MRRIVPAFIALYLVAAAPVAFPQEADLRVPELEAFHEVIAPIWHTAYPKKDIAALKGYVPEIERLAAAVYKAKLPAILQEKEANWQAGLAKFQKSVEAYAAAAKGTDDQALLTAAESLHTRYERLARALRPVLKESEEFHKVFYVVYHRLLPDKKFKEIRDMSQDLKAKAEAIVKAKLTKRLEGRKDKFQAAAADLVAAAASLAGASGGTDDAAVEKAVLALHEKFVALEKIIN